MRTSFHHQPEAQHPKSSSYPQAGRPITPSFGGKADISQRLLPLATSSEQILELRPVDRFCGLDGLKADPDRGLGARGSRVAWTVNRNASKVSLNAMARLSCIFRQPVRLGTRIRPWRSEGPRSVPSRSTERPISMT